MDILALHLSPRKNGNSDIMLTEFLKGAASVGATATRFSVADHHIKPCHGCSSCEKTGQCVITDDDMTDLYPLLSQASKIVVATSLFFYDVPAQGKALIDRSQVLWSRHYALKQSAPRPEAKGFLLALGATKGQDLFVPVHLSVKYFFDAIGLPRKVESLCFRQIEGEKAMANKPDYLAQIYQAGVTFALKNDQTSAAPKA